MQVCIKHYNDLSTDELYRILRLRVEVFVVEQRCPYQELDGRDTDAYHVFILDEKGECMGCLRVFMKDGTTAQIGRVVTSRKSRSMGLGAMLMEQGVYIAKDILKASSVYLEAQTYAVGFYKKSGFKVCSEEFLEDGIPHVGMILYLCDRF